jgi:hypothetical protein
MTTIRNLILLALFILPAWASAAQFTCSIQDVLRLDKNGAFAPHGWSSMYQKRKFFLDADTGKVTGTTALKVRLYNYNADTDPVVMRNNGYTAITLFRDTGQYALIQIDPAKDGDQRPFFYHAAVGMMLTGTCSES